MTKTYSEQYQAALFRAAREVRGIASEVLSDMQNEVELTNQATHLWAQKTAKYYAEKANELETQAHEVCVASNRAVTLQAKSRDIYSEQINAYEKRRADALFHKAESDVRLIRNAQTTT